MTNAGMFDDAIKNTVINIKNMKYSPSSLSMKYADDLIYSKKILTLD